MNFGVPERPTQAEERILRDYASSAFSGFAVGIFKTFISASP